MKKIFFLFLLVISIKAFSQNDTTKYFTSNDYGWKYQRLKAVRAFILPYDTVINKLGLVALNGSVYLGDGIKWAVVGAGAGTGTDSSIYATRFWVGANYYNKTQSDARYLQTIVGLNVSALNNDNRYWDSVRAKEWGNATFQPIGSYLTSYTETDPIYSASSWFGTTNNSGNWNTAYSKRLSSAGLTSSTLTLTLADASTVTASVPTFNQNTTGSAATLGTSRYIYGNLFNGSADITSTITDIYIESASNWNAAYTNRITTANSPLSISSNTLSITQAGTGTDGFLSSTDWNTFNGKQNALGYTAENNANKGVNNGYASLDGSGKIPTSQMPNLALNNVWTVASQSAMLALSTAVVGDVAVRSDSSITYVLKSVDYTNPANWVKLLFPTAPVISVNGLTGAVNLTTNNISESGNLYYTDARARAALSFSAGSGGYNSSTGVITIPTNNNQISNGANYLTANQNITLSGDITGSGTTAITGTLATVNSNTGSWGGASSVPTFTVNGKGLITAAGNTSIQIAESQVTNLVSDLAGKQAAITNGTGFLKNNGSGTWSYDNSNYLPLSASSLYPLTNSLYFAKDGGVSIASKNAALNAYDTLNFYASIHSFNGGDFYIRKNNATFTLSRSDGSYGLRISQDNTVGSISFNTKLSDNSTWQPYIKIGEGNSSSTSHLFLQPTNGNTYIGSSAAFSVSPNGALNGTSATFSSSVTASDFYGNLDWSYITNKPTIGFTPNSDTTVTANYTCTARDAGRNIFVNSSSSVTISMPQDSDASIAYTLPQNQKTITVWQQGTGSVVIAAGTGATVNVMDGASTIIGRYGAATLVKQAANTWYGAGALK